MATNTVTGVLVCSDGTNVPLKAELAEGTETNLTTDTVYTVTAQNVGDYALGKTVISALVESPNFNTRAKMLEAIYKFRIGALSYVERFPDEL